ncbi:hypothetical protein NDU88_005322 [Pleurodeles waltl]|uniref:Uncharacterized protein n=1 Tax=Pleurodeles waltl TaxID=8319 RepID=A0AAV7UJK0_PLEWA|nr:hypothetical protein NDU88_005322 [Pleurodeles waltl]
MISPLDVPKRIQNQSCVFEIKSPHPRLRGLSVLVLNAEERLPVSACRAAPETGACRNARTRCHGAPTRPGRSHRRRPASPLDAERRDRFLPGCMSQLKMQPLVFQPDLSITRLCKHITSPAVGTRYVTLLELEAPAEISLIMK